MCADLALLLTVKDSALGNISVLEFISLSPHSPSSAPPPAPPPQDKLQLLHTSFDVAFTSLAGQVKELSAKVNGSRPPPKVATAKKPSAQPTPKPCALAKTLAQPSLVVALHPSAHGADIPLAICRSPQEIVTHLNAEFVDAHHPITLSATQWTAKHNLVVTAGPDTSVHQLTQASHLISDLLSTFLSHDSTPFPITTHENVKWSQLLINGIPTGASSSCGPYTPSECQQALLADNPAFRTLCLTQPPSWVRAPSTYGPSSVSSLVVAFEDPLGESL